ncbi:MAG: segregation/condensation protein A [Spirochaetales bacterium]|jgi:segregation and condensation protein A|nr:segregation/condensation protein A [Spirochaetales bacterium]
MDQQETQNQHLFKIGEFEGPLDLLLFLIRKSEVNIYDIPIADITEQYLAYIEYATKINLDNITEFYGLAVTLLHIKSQMLLPVEVDLGEDYGDPRLELVEKLIDYQKYRKISDLIAEKGRETEWLIERKKKQRILPFPDEEEFWKKIEVWDLLKTFSNLMSTLSSERIIDLYEEVTINEKLTLINENLERKGEFLFTDLITRAGSLMDIVCSFLAILEAVKRKTIAIFQNRMFGDIRIRPANAIEEPA